MASRLGRTDLSSSIATQLPCLSRQIFLPLHHLGSPLPQVPLLSILLLWLDVGMTSRSGLRWSVWLSLRGLHPHLPSLRGPALHDVTAEPHTVPTAQGPAGRRDKEDGAGGGEVGTTTKRQIQHNTQSLHDPLQLMTPRKVNLVKPACRCATG